MKKPILEFTVKLSKWRCGGSSIDSKTKPGTDPDATTNGYGETELLNNAGFKCCLGFACQQAGYKGKLTGNGNPYELKYHIPGLTVRDDDGILSDSPFTNGAIAINDNLKTTLREKQELLIELGKQHNIKIKFVP